MRHLTVTTSVRPGRVAVLVDINDERWQSTCLRIIEYFTRMWGGTGNVIIPTDGKSISPLFWKLLDRFDPDYLEAYKRSGRDIEIEEPGRFDEIYNKQIASWEKQIGLNADEYAAKTIRENLRCGSATQFEVSSELQQQLKERLAPFHFQQYVVEAGAVWADSTPSYPHTDVVDILPQIEHATRVLRVSDANSTVPSLWWASAFGRMNSDMQSMVVSQNIELLELGSTRDEVRNLIALAVEGHEHINSVAFVAKVPAETVREWLQAYPSNLSTVGLSWYRSTQSHYWEEPPIAVAGNSIQDFALYYALSRMRPYVVWVLPSITTDALGPAKQPEVNEEFHFAHALHTLGMATAQGRRGLRLVSASLSKVDLEKIKTRLQEVALMSVLTDCEIGDADGSISSHPIRLYETNNASRMRSVTVPDDGVIPLFETPLPKNFRRVQPSKHRWMTELGFVKYALPRHYALGWWMTGAPHFTTKDVRVTCDGPAYFCPSSFIHGVMTQRPQSHDPQSESQRR